MSIGAALYTYLSAQSGVTDLVSTRIYPGRAPQDVTYPYITWDRVAQQEGYHLGGNDTLARVSVQFDCWDDDMVTADAVAEALHDALDSVRGTWGTVRIDNVQLENILDNATASDPGAEFGPFRITMDWDIWYQRA